MNTTIPHSIDLAFNTLQQNIFTTQRYLDHPAFFNLTRKFDGIPVIPEAELGLQIVAPPRNFLEN